ncbi:MAG: tetratricopeptide repeat protein [Planctomycetes bacterium]|nr:tetratricopeptide repeat protein [Planctomycetota bacterium]
MADWSILKKRVAQKWQIPLFFLSLALLAGALLRISPSSTPPSLEDAEEFLGAMVSGGMYERAILTAHALLNEEKYTDVELSPIHLALARAYSAQANVRGEHTAAMGRVIVDHYQRATSSGSALDVDDFEKWGWACYWQRDYAAATEYLQTAIDGGSEDRLDLLRQVIWLGRYELDTPPQQLNEKLDRLIAETGEHRLDLCLWAIEQKLEVLEATDQLEQAATLLVRNEERFRGSDLWDHYDYLKGLLLYKTGHYDEAETLLRAVRNRVERGDEVYAMTGWLLGRVVLNDGGPQRPAEALSFFDDVVAYHPGGLYSLASRIGQAEAYALLERHDDAIGTYRIATEDLDTLRRNRLVSVDVLRTSMGVMAETLRQAGNARAAVEYARLAITLVDRNNTEQAIMFLRQLARVLEIRADEIEAEAAAGEEEAFAIKGATSEGARRLYAEAAATCLELAKYSITNQGESADWSWQAAELCARSGDRARAMELFRSFAAEYPSHPLVARSLLRVGQLNRALGDLPAAIEAYRECYRRFPRMLDGVRALVPLARAYLASGP